MARWVPCKRRDFIRKLRRLRFDEPRPGKRHFYMTIDQQMMILPKLKDLLKQAEDIFGREITLEEWLAL